MALHYNLPVYKASYDLFLQIFHLTKNFTKEYKYTIGEKLKNEMLELLLNLYRANSQHQKKEILQKGRENIEIVRVLLRIVKDLQQISIKKYADISIVIENISKQVTAWQKSSK